MRTSLLLFQKISAEWKIILSGLLVIFFLSCFLPGYLLPTDILHNFLAYSNQQWQPPQNSLISDSITQFEPWRHFTKEELVNFHNIPLWNSLSAFGTPFLANPQTEIFFPLSFFYYLLPAHVALYLISFLKIYLLGVFSFFYFREIRCSYFASIFGACATAFAAFPLVWLLWPHTSVYMFFPLLLLITEKIYRSKANQFNLYIILTLVFVLVILAGHPETQFHSILIFFLYSLIRLFKQRKKLFIIFVSFISSLGLTAFQTIPFINYLLHSYAFLTRQQQVTNYYLPLKSIIFEFIPFLLGAPQYTFYKSISEFTNFQETVGGYISVNALLLALYGLFTMQKNQFVRIWTVIAIFCFGVSYAIFPLSLFNKIPIIHSFANQRLIGFFGISLIVIATITLDERFNWNSKWTKKIFPIFSILIFLILLTLIALLPHVSVLSGRQEFLHFLFLHITLLYITTILFILLLTYVKDSFHRKCGIIFLLLAQTIGLLWNYNTVSKQSDYYPVTPVISKLESLPKGSILEIGNAVLPPDTYMMYNISSAESYDALEIAPYRTLFTLIFPYKNIVGNVDQINMDSFRDMHISYIVSDFDINLQRSIIHSEEDTVLPPIAKNKTYLLSFKPQSTIISGIRVLTANFNRVNSCKLLLTLTQNKQSVYKKQIACSTIRDHSYLFIPLHIPVIVHRSYTLSFSSVDATNTNSVSLFGSEKAIPYFEVFYPPKTDINHFRLLFHNNSTYVFKVPEYPLLTFPGKIISEQSTITNTTIIENGKTSNILTIPKVKYPGWVATIDGLPATLGNNIFLSVIVPTGKHIVAFSYAPLDLYLGIVTTLFTFLILTIVTVRRIIFKRNLQALWHQISKRIISKTTWYQHFLAFCGAFLVSTILLVTMIKLIPIKFSTPQTTAINWLTVHHYPKQQDTFYYLFGVLFEFLSTTVLYTLWLILRLKK